MIWTTIGNMNSEIRVLPCYLNAIHVPPASGNLGQVRTLGRHVISVVWLNIEKNGTGSNCRGRKYHPGWHIREIRCGVARIQSDRAAVSRNPAGCVQGRHLGNFCLLEEHQFPDGVELRRVETVEVDTTGHVPANCI